MMPVLTKKTLDIGEVVDISGVPPSTLRYYESKGLIRSTGRSGLRRMFDAYVLQQLEFIALGQHAGLSLDEIASMFSSEGKLQVDRAFITHKATEIEKSIQQLSAVRNTLLHVAKCQAPNHMECPSFQKLLRVAGKIQKNKSKQKSKAGRKHKDIKQSNQ